MADIIQIRAGNMAKMPDLRDRELGYVRDESTLYIGTPNGNEKVNKYQDAKLTAHDNKFIEIDTALEEIRDDLSKKLEATKANTVATLASDAELVTVIETVNELIYVLQTSGIMNA